MTDYLRTEMVLVSLVTTRNSHKRRVVNEEIPVRRGLGRVIVDGGNRQQSGRNKFLQILKFFTFSLVNKIIVILLIHFLTVKTLYVQLNKSQFHSPIDIK